MLVSYRTLGCARRRRVGDSPSFISRYETELPWLRGFSPSVTRANTSSTDQGLGWSTPSTRAWNGNNTSILQFLLVPQRPAPELVDGLGDPRRVAEDSHVRSVVDHTLRLTHWTLRHLQPDGRPRVSGQRYDQQESKFANIRPLLPRTRRQFAKMLPLSVC